MAHELPDLPYPKDALAPHVSQETVEHHFGKHHLGYVTKLNKLIAGTEFDQLPLEETVRKATGAIFNNAAQAWNHDFYWRSLSPQGGGEPAGALARGIEEAFGSFGEFRERFRAAAEELFGSGWVWLVHNKDGSLAIESTSNAGNPLTQGQTPLLVLDVWEHAYYIDYRSKRERYIEGFWKLVHWEFAAKNLGV